MQLNLEPICGDEDQEMDPLTIFDQEAQRIPEANPPPIEVVKMQDQMGDLDESPIDPHYQHTLPSQNESENQLYDASSKGINPIFILDVNIGSSSSQKKVIPLEIYEHEDVELVVESFGMEHQLSKDKTMKLLQLAR